MKEKGVGVPNYDDQPEAKGSPSTFPYRFSLLYFSALGPVNYPSAVPTIQGSHPYAPPFAGKGFGKGKGMPFFGKGFGNYTPEFLCNFYTVNLFPGFPMMGKGLPMPPPPGPFGNRPLG